MRYFIKFLIWSVFVYMIVSAGCLDSDPGLCGYYFYCRLCLILSCLVGVAQVYVFTFKDDINVV